MDMKETLEKYHMVQRGDLVLAAVSGGADSVCMLRLLQEAAQEMDFALVAMHVEHGIRGKESLADMQFTQELCEGLGVPLRVRHVDAPGYAAKHGLGLEEAARQLRYGAIEQAVEEVLSGEWMMPEYDPSPGVLADGMIHVALAHHMQDQAETVLFRLARGSGTDGLAGMRPISRLPQGYDLIRPMLEMRREEIESLLNTWGQSYCTDATNEDVSYARNRLRLRVLPELAKVNSHATEHIAQTAELLGQQQDYIAAEAAKALGRIGQAQEEEMSLDISGLLGLHPALQREVLRQALIYVTRQRKNLTAGHVEQLLALTRKQSGSRLSLPYNVEAAREFSEIRIYRRGIFDKGESPDLAGNPLQRLSGESGQDAERTVELIQITEEQLQELLTGGGTLAVALGGGNALEMDILPANNLSENRKKKYTKCFDYDMMKEGFSIRRRREGDYMRMSSGHRKKLKQYLIETKIPAAERQQLWLLAQESCVFWIVGGRAGAGCEVTEQTRYVLGITHKEEKDEFERETSHQRVSDRGSDSCAGCRNRCGYYE